jgi:hypothetical protein
MKHISPLLFFSILLLAIGACKKDENKIFYEEGTAPVLAASTSNVSLEAGQESNTALTLNWTNPDYKFTTGLSSQDVTYTLEMDTLGANFKSSKKFTTVIAKELSKSYTVGELNAILGNDMTLQLDPRRNYTMELRVTSSIGSAVKLASNVISFTTKPFAPPPKVEPPASNELYITGNAVASDWTNSPPLTQKFTRISKTFYQIEIALAGGKSYTFLPVHGSWDYKYSINTKNDPALIYGGDFKSGGEDILAPPVSGNYKIEVDFQIGKFKVTKL